MTAVSRFRWAGLAGLLLAGAACDSDGPHGPPGNAPRFHGAQVAANPHNTISAAVAITAAGFDSAWVRFWTVAGPAERTPAFPFGADTVLRVPVLGLDTVAGYQLEVVLAAGATVSARDTLAFTTGALPAWVPQPGASGGDTLPGYTLLSTPDGPVIVDNAGTVVWYRFRPGGTLGSWQAQANGLYTWLATPDPQGYFVHNSLGEEIGRLACVGYPTRFHDFVVQPGGDYWALCDEFRTMDLTAVGGVADASVNGTVVQHIAADGTLLFEWLALDHFQITDLPAADRTGPNVNFTHGNGIAVDTDGNVLLSSRSLNEITKINVATGAVLWRLGGLANQFTFVDDPKGAFEHQHGLRLSAAGEIQILDNGQAAPSRVVRYQVDPAAMTATLTLEFIHSPTTFTAVGGSTQWLPGGRGMVSFGRAGQVAEFDGTGTGTWQLTGLDGTYVFRSQRITSLYFPGRDQPAP